MSDFRVSATCPYCGFQNRITVTGNLYSEIDIVSCDYEGGGCVGIFAARSILRIETEGLEIKGCEPPPPEPLPPADDEEGGEG